MDLITLNVGGTRFTTRRSTIAKYPNTVLAKAINKQQQPFFDRDPTIFKAVLGFYRSGKLMRPPNVSEELFQSEIDFWGISEPIPNILIRDQHKYQLWANKFVTFIEAQAERHLSDFELHGFYEIVVPSLKHYDWLNRDPKPDEHLGYLTIVRSLLNAEDLASEDANSPPIKKLAVSHAKVQRRYFELCPTLSLTLKALRELGYRVKLRSDNISCNDIKKRVCLDIGGTYEEKSWIRIPCECTGAFCQRVLTYKVIELRYPTDLYHL